MTPVIWSVKCTFGGKILGSDPNLTFCVLIILLHLNNNTEKTHTDLTRRLLLYFVSTKKQPLEVFCKKKVFLKISQNSQKNINARVSFLIKLQAEVCNLILKKDSGTGVFLLRTLFLTKHLWTTSSVCTEIMFTYNNSSSNIFARDILWQITYLLLRLMHCFDSLNIFLFKYFSFLLRKTQFFQRVLLFTNADTLFESLVRLN